MYAIIATGGKQYKVAEGDIINVEKLGAKEGDEVTFDVVAVNNDKDMLCGEACKKSSVKATVLGEGKGKKVVVYKYKRKSGYHKKQGHRQPFTKVEIKAINA
ncbi:MAG: 50S ribosomal protein L21 [Lachnospiraceae bacterium]|nr:50S ribosomal protein L21 [Lachnospiraceae bacterium]MBQ8913314.1 50S ribosomal protein L21 [Lachnospiraceae bacterium]MBQ9278948.1 50S ribosomal protein L21 [Lachnospiraceae bacterium]